MNAVLSSKSIRGWCWLWVGLAFASGGAGRAHGQQASASVPAAGAVWVLHAGEEVWPWPLAETPPLDSLDAVTARVLGHLRRDGHYFADLDTVRVDTTTHPPAVHVHVRPGPRVVVGRVRLLGMTVFDSLDVRDRMDTRPGRPLDPARLEADLQVILRRYEAEGFPLAQIHVREVTLLPGDPPRLGLTLQVDEGKTLVLDRVELPGAERTRPGYAARVAGVAPGAPLVAYDPELIRQRLLETGFFEEVGPPELVMEPGGQMVLRLPVKEAAPGAFDLVLGYLPATGTGGRGSLVGNGHLLLRNLFGAGRVLSLRLNRLPGQVSSVDVRMADPFLFGLPFSGEGRFEGLQQDSTYGKQRYQLELGYRFGAGLTAFVTVSRENTSPGQAGLRLRDGRQRIPRAEALFAGFGVRFQRVDRPVNPRRGLVVETNFERGRKQRTATVLTAEGDTTREGTSLRQERLRLHTRFYLPTFRRQVLAFGGEAAVLVSNRFDESDLFRFGGATSLRGYDEERFRGRFVARTFVEYRYQIDRLSYAYLFFDLGYVDTPAVIGLAASRGVHPGYGLGIQFSTALGLVNASYAINSEDGPTDGRVHVGLSFGL
ncbi:BamA/OMP85 family outer membrane protein [Rhodocaloribacter litoris]|uniref:BamA/OMP85 family outer membrane protein n=1 Tax=Rhodocaloribacter litoris TaxID=2558931 RepID=UPI001E6403F1|nr:BamA/TamA family outer membrane protein [Rhodocaloribacter litoris]